MKKKSHKIVFFGNERLATGVSTKVPTLQKLLSAGYDVKAVVSNYEAGISRARRQLEIAEIAHDYHIPVLTPHKPDDILDQLQKYRADLAVLAAYGRIIPRKILELFPYGIINIHPSLLPDKRGPTPIEQALLEGAGQAGVSIMRLVREMDAGPVYAQQKIKLDGGETKQFLADNLSAIGGNLLLENLPAILRGTLEPIPQNESRATYTALIKKTDGKINWHKPALQIEREIRAYAGWPRSQAELNGVDLTITKATVDFKSGKAGDIINDRGKLVIYCGENSLSIDRLQPAGKNEMSINEFLRGYAKRLNLS